MKSSSRKLNRKIRACAGLAGVGGLVAASSLGMASKANGEPVRTQLNEILPHGSHHSYDIDGDGDIDLSINMLLFEGVMLEAELISCTGTQCIACYAIDHEELDFTVIPHVQGDLIDVQGGGPCAHLLACSTNPSPFVPGDFINPSSPRYAGFCYSGPDFDPQLPPDYGETHQGWVELELHEVCPGIFDLEVIAIGHETDPLTPILAGVPGVSAVGDDIPRAGVELFDIVPNPFNAGARIGFALAEAAPATIRIFDSSGLLVRTFSHDGSRGDNAVKWDGRDDNGRSVSSGVYFCRLEALGATRSGKMVLLK